MNYSLQILYNLGNKYDLSLCKMNEAIPGLYKHCNKLRGKQVRLFKFSVDYLAFTKVKHKNTEKSSNFKGFLLFRFHFSFLITNYNFKI